MKTRKLGNSGLEVSEIGLLGKGFLTVKIDGNTTFGSNDFRSTVPRLSPENQPGRRFNKRGCATQKCNSRTGCNCKDYIKYLPCKLP
jgi:hypothetical protein